MSETTTTNRTPDTAAIESDLVVIEQALDHMKRTLADRSMRAANATQAGATMAYEVARFLDDPEGVGTDALGAAYRLFMGRHSGNFTDSVMAVQLVTGQAERSCKDCGITFPVNRVKAEKYEREAECPEWFCYDCGGEEL